MFAMISVSVGYGTDGSSTPTIVAVPTPRRTCFPTTAGSLLNAAFQNRYVSTAAPGAFGPSSCGVNNRPMEGRRPITSKNDPLTTPAFTIRGSAPGAISARSTVEKSPKAAMVVARCWKSETSGIENV